VPKPGTQLISNLPINSIKWRRGSPCNSPFNAFLQAMQWSRGFFKAWSLSC